MSSSQKYFLPDKKVQILKLKLLKKTCETHF